MDTDEFDSRINKILRRAIACIPGFVLLGLVFGAVLSISGEGDASIFIGFALALVPVVVLLGTFWVDIVFRPRHEP